MKNRSKLFAAKLFHVILLSFSLALTSCGKDIAGQLVKDVRFSSSTEDGRPYGTLTMVLGTGSVLLPGVELPINNPYVPGMVLGTFSLHGSLTGGTEVGIRFDFDQIPEVEQAEGRLLPNGRPIPVALPQEAKPVAIQVQEKSRVYLARVGGMTLVGTALVLKEFDLLAHFVGQTDVFFPFVNETGLRGVVGLFSSNQPNQSGIAVFVEVGATHPAPPIPPVTRSVAAGLSKFMKRIQDAGKTLTLQ
jgi:hypothetical protein